MSKHEQIQYAGYNICAHDRKPWPCPEARREQREMETVQNIIHGQPTTFDRDRIVQFVLANANPGELAGIAGELAGQSIYYAMKGEYRGKD